MKEFSISLGKHFKKNYLLLTAAELFDRVMAHGSVCAYAVYHHSGFTGGDTLQDEEALYKAINDNNGLRYNFYSMPEFSEPVIAHDTWHYGSLTNVYTRDSFAIKDMAHYDIDRHVMDISRLRKKTNLPVRLVRRDSPEFKKVTRYYPLGEFSANTYWVVEL